mgnify:CR=1 FL=1
MISATSSRAFSTMGGTFPKRAPSSTSQHGRSTFSSGKSAFFGLGPASDIASDRAVRCPIDGTSQLRKSAHAR